MLLPHGSDGTVCPHWLVLGTALGNRAVVLLRPCVIAFHHHNTLADGSMSSCYVNALERMVLAEVMAASADSGKDTLSARIAAIVGDGTTARIPELQRALDADPRAIGAALRELGFQRRRVWTSDDYALTCWRKTS